MAERSGILNWLRRSWLHILLLSTVAGLFAWMVVLLVQGTSPDKPAWLLVPLTAIYIVTNVYVALASAKAADASARAAVAMESTVEEMRVSRLLGFSPTVSFPVGQVFWEEDGGVTVQVGNLSDQPALGFQVFLWGLETDEGDVPLAVELCA